MTKQTLVPFLFLLFIATSLSAQDLNSYKYVIVPKKFDFLKEADKYQLNSLTRFLFKKQGFEVLYDSETLPEELANNQCKALRSNVIKGKGLFVTKLKIELKDCQNKVIFTSSEGVSREKEYKVAYTQALRKAYKSISVLNYKYQPSSVQETTMQGSGTKVENTPVTKEIVAEKPTPPANDKVKQEVKSPIVNDVHKDVLYGQSMANGYQVVDATPKVVMKLLFSGKKDVFIVEGRDAIVFKREGVWMLSEYNGNVTKTKVINLKL